VGTVPAAAPLTPNSVLRTGANYSAVSRLCLEQGARDSATLGSNVDTRSNHPPIPSHLCFQPQSTAHAAQIPWPFLSSSHTPCLHPQPHGIPVARPSHNPLLP
jgi:hypothetical protein